MLIPPQKLFVFTTFVHFFTKTKLELFIEDNNSETM